MKQKMKQFITRLVSKSRNQAGFTLLEILVVLVIMGFLIAMVAPRLAGVSGSAVDTVCDSNQNRMVGYLATYFEQTGNYPSELTNLVEETAAGVYQIPAVSDNDPTNGPETLAAEFNARNHFRIHYLDADEARELRNMGVATVLNLNAYDGYDGTALKANYDNTAGVNNDVPIAATVVRAPTLERVPVAAGVGVAMVGFGSDATNTWTEETNERGWGEPDFLGRIVLGMGAESGLIKSGIIANAAHCPGGIQDAANTTYNDYNVTLPRLQATVDRANYPIGAALSAVNYEGDNEPGTAYDYTANAGNYRVRSFDVHEAQEKWQYNTQCPEGHMYPADDGEFWGVDLDGATGIN